MTEDVGYHKKHSEEEIKEIVNDVHPLDDRPKDRFSNTEQARQFLIDYYRSARGRVAKDRLMDLCFQAGQERVIYGDTIFLKGLLERARKEERENIENIIRARHSSCLNPVHGGTSCCNLILQDLEELNKEEKE